MQIPDRIKQFLKHTNSFGVIIEEGKPSYIVASFDWAERALLGAEEETKEVNKDISYLAEETKEGSNEINQPNP